MREKQNSAEYQETKQHGSRLFPFNIYPCTIPLDFPVVSLHWHKEMELIYVKKGKGQIQLETENYEGNMISAVRIIRDRRLSWLIRLQSLFPMFHYWSLLSAKEAN